MKMQLSRGVYGDFMRLALSLLVVGVSHLVAGPVIDPAGDFLSTYTGPKNGDVDVLRANVWRNDSHTLTFTAVLNGLINTTPGELYVFGLDRGQGTQRFLAGTPAIGAGIFFDSVLLLNPATTTAQFNDFITPANNHTFGAGTVTIAGNQLSTTIPLSFFPSTGFSPANYTWNFWPRVGVGSNTQIFDFAPDASNAGVGTPEPATFLLSGVALLCVISKARRRGNAV
jgi:hypothetical protein